MVVPRFRTSHRRPSARKMKIIPSEQLGVEALPTITSTMEGVLEWLKAERLHKYWPIFSRMNYPTLIGLTEANMDYSLRCIGSDPITNGARGRILRCTMRLRERSPRLRSINEETPLEEIAHIFLDIAKTPISSTENEPDGFCLVQLFCHKLNQVVGFHGPSIVENSTLRTALLTYVARPEVPVDDKTYIIRLIENLAMAVRTVTPPRRRSISSRCSPYSSPPSSVHSSSSASPQHYQLYRNQNGFPLGMMGNRGSDRQSPSTQPTHCATVGGGRPAVVTQNPQVPESRSFLPKPPAELFSRSIGPEPRREFAVTKKTHDVIIKASIGATIESSFDLNKLWGGVKNQVMLDLNGTAQFPNCMYRLF